MTLTLKLLDQSACAAWDRFVIDECPEASFFHRAGWKNVIERAYGQRCYYVYAERDGQITGVLPLVHVRSTVFGSRLISNAFTIGGAAVALDDESHQALDGEALRLMEKLRVDCLELRRPVRRHDSDGWVAEGEIYANFARPIAFLEDECLKQIPRKQRAVVRKALESDKLVDEIDHHPDRLFPLYALSMRNMGTPVLSRRFLAGAMTEFAGDCDCLTVTHDGVAVSSVLNFYFRDRVMPYYTGCLPEARELGANDFMYWRLMRRALDRGCTIFDFGRSKFGTGPFNFKRNWGFEPQSTVHEYHLKPGKKPPELNPLNPKYQMFIAGWKQLPLGLANLLGPRIVRQIG